MITLIISSARASITPPPNDDDFGAKEVDEVGDADADVFGGAFDNFIHKFVAAADGFAEVATAEIGEVVAEHFGEDGFLAVFNAGFDLLEDGGAAGEGFEAALLPQPGWVVVQAVMTSSNRNVYADFFIASLLGWYRE